MSRHVNTIIISGTKALYLEKHVCRVTSMHGMMYELKRVVVNLQHQSGGEDVVCTRQMNK